ncbi:MAG: SDR family oxidoreductase [Solirubrobacteraceae bacterium]
MSVLVSGATGFLGAYVVAQLVETGDEELVCLVRGADPQARLEAALEPLLGRDWDRSRVRAVGADLAADGPLDVDVTDVTDIVHSAADVAFDRPLADARAINVGGAERMAELGIRAPRLRRYVHVSTAYVAGTHAGRFAEDELDMGQAFRNSYEQSKYEAEKLVRAAELPLRVVRPSIVVGESASGWTSSFNVLYAPLQALARGLVKRVPAHPDALVDVVPVDHVSDVVLAALHGGDEVPGDTLHAVAGEDAYTAAGLAALAAGLLDRPTPELDPDGADLPPGGLEVYAPYFTVHTRFDATGARGLGLAAPPLAEYLPRVLAFADDAQWGKRKPVDRLEDARARAA